jgi:hypothetical protein
MAAGFFLLRKGLQFLTTAGAEAPFVSAVARFAGGREQGTLFLVALALGIGLLKGRWALARTVKRVEARLLAREEPVALAQAYGVGYGVLILAMMGVGMGMAWLPLAPDVRGVIDTAVGAALMQGSILYARSALAMRKA